jgi:predicted MFS family arabinose efflux permease
MTDTAARVPMPAIIAMILLGVMGGHTTVILPLVVSGLSGALALDGARAGWIAAAEMGGVAVGALVAGLLVGTRDRRMLATVSAALAIAANLLSLASGDLASLLALRFVGALGGGGLLAVMAASVGDTDRAEAIFGLFIAVTFSVAALDFAFLPGLIAEHGLALLFVYLAATNGLALVAALVIPGRARRVEGAGTGAGAAWPVAVWLGLASIVSYYVGIGGAWALMGQIGAASGVDEAAVNAALSRASIAGIVGAIAASVLAARAPRTVMIAVGLSGVASSLIAIATVHGQGLFGVATLTLIFFWNMTVPFLMGTLALLDASGRAVAINMTLQYAGFSGGPLLAGAIAAAFGMHAVALLGAAGALGAMAFMLAALGADRKHIVRA